MLQPQAGRPLHFLLIVTRDPVGTTDEEILEFRRAGLAALAETDSAAAEWITRPIAGASLRALKWIAARPGGDSYVVEEATTSRSGQRVILQSLHAIRGVRRSELRTLEQIYRSVELLVPARSADATRLRLLAGVRASPQRLFVRRRSVTIHVDGARRLLRVRVRARVALEPEGARAKLRFRLHPYPLARLESVRIDGREARYRSISEGTGTLVEIDDLDVGPTPAQSIEIGYTLHPGWLGSAVDQAAGLFFGDTEVHCTGLEWLPRFQLDDDQPDSLLASRCPSTIEITAPARFRVFASGRLSREGASGETRTWRFSNGRSRLPYLAFIAIDGDCFRLARRGRSVTVAADYAAAGSAQLEPLAATILSGVHWLDSALMHSNLTREIAVVFYSRAASQGFGPLVLLGRPLKTPLPELDARTMGENTLRETALHELAHLWFGGLLTAPEHDWPLAHEALANLMTLRLLEAHTGSAAAIAYRKWQVARLRAQWQNHGGFTEPQSRTVAATVALFLLRDYVGPRAFDRTLKRFCNSSRNGQIVLADFIDAVERVTGLPALAVMDTWYSAGSCPTLTLRTQLPERPKRNRHVTVRLLVESTAPLYLVLPTELRGPGRVSHRRIRFSGTRTVHASFTVAHAVDRVIFDADCICPVDCAGR